MKLISMTDFVLELYNNTNAIKNENGWEAVQIHRIQSFVKCANYANFLKKPLKLEMFVPCDDEGNVLKEVEKGRDKLYDSQDTSSDSQHYHQQWHMRINQYQQAKEKVLFEGFETDKSYQAVNHKLRFFVYDIRESDTIEDYIKFNLTLTESAKKQIGINE